MPICQPLTPCCCKGPWTLGPGESQPLTLEWSRWLNSSGGTGFTLAYVDQLMLLDYSVNPPVAADPSQIRIVSGLPHDLTPGDNTNGAAFANVMGQYHAVQVFIEAHPQARIGAQYRLDICVVARDCDGRRARMCDCVNVVIAPC